MGLTIHKSHGRPTHVSTIARCAAPAIVVLLAVLGSNAAPAQSGHPPRPASANGPLLVIVQLSGLMGSPSEIVKMQHGHLIQVLVSHLPYPPMGGLAPSPNGHTVAFGEAATIAPGNPPPTQGLWVVPATGGAPRRLLLPPSSVAGNQLGIGPVAWSPDGSTLAYAVNPAGGVLNTTRPETGLGLWLTRYDRVHSHLLATPAQLGAVDTSPSRAPFPIDQLSWSADGRLLAVSTRRPLPGSRQPTQTIPVVLAVDRRGGSVRVLVSGAKDGVFAPRGRAIAYVANGSGGAATATLRLAVGPGYHGRILASGPISSPAWAPDGRSIAYIDGGTVIRTVDATTGRLSVVATLAGLGRFPAGAQFVHLTWMHA